MGQLVRSVVVQSHGFESGFFIDLADLLNFLCVFALFLTHQSVLSVKLVDDVTAFGLHFLSTLLGVLLTLLRDCRLSLQLFFHRNLSWFSHTRVICLCLELQLVDVEATESVGKLDLAALEELEISIVVIDAIA